MKTERAHDSAAALLRQERAENRDRKAHDRQHEHGQFGGYVFRHLRSRPASVQLPALRRPPRAAGPRPRPAASHASNPHHDEPLAHDRDPAASNWLLNPDQPRVVVEAGGGGDAGDGHHEQDEHRRMLARAQGRSEALGYSLQCRTLPDPRGAGQALKQRLLAAALPGAQALFGAAGGLAGDESALLQSVISLVASAAQAPPTGAALPLSAVMLAAAEAWLRHTRSPQALSLAQVKQALLSARLPRDGGVHSERVQNALMLLPLLVLNLTRPRTGAQREQALERLQLMRQSRGLY